MCVLWVGFFKGGGHVGRTAGFWVVGAEAQAGCFSEVSVVMCLMVGMEGEFSPVGGTNGPVAAFCIGGPVPEGSRRAVLPNFREYRGSEPFGREH